MGPAGLKVGRVPPGCLTGFAPSQIPEPNYDSPSRLERHLALSASAPCWPYYELQQYALKRACRVMGGA